MSVKIEATGHTIDDAFAALASDPRVLQRVSTDTLIHELTIRMPHVRIVIDQDDRASRRNKKAA